MYQPGRKLIMCLSITHTWLRAEASLPARLSLDIQFLIEKSVVTVLFNNFNLMKNRRPTKKRPVMAYCLQPHIDLYS